MKNKGIWAVAAAAVMFGIALLVARCVAADRVPQGSVVSYHVVADDSALLLFRSYDSKSRASGWLSRVDSSGRTVWLRRLPGAPDLGDALRVGDGLVAVRYTRTNEQAEEVDAMTAFDLDGHQLWDNAIGTRYRRRNPAAMNAVSGNAAPDVFLEWIESEGDKGLVGVSQRSGRVSFRKTLPRSPSRISRLRSRVLWSDDDAPHKSMIYSIDLQSSTVREREVVGGGCALDDDFMTLVPNEQTTSLVLFPGGLLDSPRVISDDFDPFGDGRPYGLWHCGRLGQTLVLLVEAVRDDGQGLLIFTDERGGISRSLRLPMNLRGPDGSLPGSFADQAPLTGQLKRFAALLVPQRGGRDEISVLDLQTQQVVSRTSLPSESLTHVFTVGQRAYASTKGTNNWSSLSVIDQDTGIVTARKTITVTSPGLIGQPLAPNQVGTRTVWLVPYADAPLNKPPVAVLDSASLRPIYVSPQISVTAGS